MYGTSYTDLSETHKVVANSPAKKTPVLAKDVDSKKFAEYKTTKFSAQTEELLAPFPYISVSAYDVDSITKPKFQPNKKTCSEDTVPFYSRSFYLFENLEHPPVPENLLEFPGGVDTRN
jgi:hypothetical protein